MRYDPSQRLPVKQMFHDHLPLAIEKMYYELRITTLAATNVWR